MGKWSGTLEEVAVGTVLITGGLGCLGGGLAKHLVNTGFRVLVGSSRQNAQLPEKLKQCSLVCTDFGDLEKLNKVCAEADYVIHLAAVNAQLSERDPELAKRVNSFGTKNLIKASIQNEVKYFLYFSTAHVYGSPLIGQIDENTEVRPLHPYALTHKLAEDFLLSAIESGKINGNIIRLSNSIGLPVVKEANCWMLFTNDACRQAIIHRRIAINANPSDERDFITMDSVYKIVQYFLLHYPSINDPIFNVGSGITHSLMQMAEIIACRCEALFGYSPQITYSKEKLIKSSKLTYKVDKLTSLMHDITDNDLSSAIDEILKFCQTENS